jgi:mRNA-degrading endonuclease toxin of MazEF toxin-antitoxin module
MKEIVHQGDLIKLEGIKSPVLVVSKDFFNQTSEIIGCPVLDRGPAGALHILIKAEDFQGYAHCEKLALLDLNVRGFSVISRIPISDLINIADAIQGIFDYI